VSRAEEGHPVEHLLLELFEIEIDDGRDVECDELRYYEATYDDESQRSA
jgi:hypothetical protein